MTYYKEICNSAYNHLPFNKLILDTEPPSVYKNYYLKTGVVLTTDPPFATDAIICSECVEPWMLAKAQTLGLEIKYLIECIERIESDIPEENYPIQGKFLISFTDPSASYMDEIISPKFVIELTTSGESNLVEVIISLSELEGSYDIVGRVIDTSTTFEVEYIDGIEIDLNYINQKLLSYITTVLNMDFRAIPDALAEDMLITNTIYHSKNEIYEGDIEVTSNDIKYKYTLQGAEMILPLDVMYSVVVQLAVDYNVAEETGLAYNSGWPTAAITSSTVQWKKDTISRFINVMKSRTSPDWNIIVPVDCDC